MSETYLKPIPPTDDDNAPHWAGARQGELRVQRCSDCGSHRYPAARWCAECQGDRLEWVTVSGKGRIWSWCDFHRAYFEGFKAELPWRVVLVDLDEGPKLYSNLVGVPEERLRIGMPVRAVFEAATPELSLVKFEEDL